MPTQRLLLFAIQPPGSQKTNINEARITGTTQRKHDNADEGGNEQVAEEEQEAFAVFFQYAKYGNYNGHRQEGGDVFEPTVAALPFHEEMGVPEMLVPPGRYGHHGTDGRLEGDGKVSGVPAFHPEAHVQRALGGWEDEIKGWQQKKGSQQYMPCHGAQVALLLIVTKQEIQMKGASQDEGKQVAIGQRQQ